MNQEQTDITTGKQKFCSITKIKAYTIRTLPIKDKTENNILLCSYPKFFPL